MVEGYIDIPGSGDLRVSTPADVSRSLEARKPRPTLGLRTYSAVTASASTTDPRDEEYQLIRFQPWQSQALYYVTVVPECNFASRFYAQMLSNLEIFPAFRAEDGDLTPIEAGPAVDLLNKIQDPSGGRNQLQGSYGRLMFTTGEGQLFGRNLNTDRERWAFVWNAELTVHDNGSITWYPRLNGDSFEYQPDEAVAYRLWNPSPLRSGEAESPMQAAIQTADELLILSKSVRATGVSRILQGMLIVPQELSPGSIESLGDEDPQNNPFMADLIEHVTGVVENAGTAEAAAPFILEGAYEYLDRVQWISLHDPQADILREKLRAEAVERLARGFDFPPEILTGFAETNHWSAKQIMDQAWRQHGAPIAQRWCNDLNEAYLRPSLKDAGFERWDEVVIGYDEANVIVRPDRGQTAVDLWNIGALGYDAVRKANGFDESDEMSKEEQELWLTIKTRDPTLLPTDLAPAPSARGPVAQNGNTPDSNPPPLPGPDGTSRPDGSTASARIMAAAEVALLRCREIAGSRILSDKDKCPDCLKPALEVPKHLVAATVGPDVLRQIKALDTMKLVHGGADTFRTWLSTNDVADEQAAALAQMIEVYASKTLFERKHTLPSGFHAHVERVREMNRAVEHH